MQALGLTQEDAKSLYGHHIVEFIMNPGLGFRNLIRKEDFVNIALSRIKSFQTDLAYLIENGEFDEEIERWKNMPDFTGFWETAKTLKIDTHEFEQRKFSLKIGKSYRKFYFAVIPVDYDRRFEIIEFIEKE